MSNYSEIFKEQTKQKEIKSNINSSNIEKNYQPASGEDIIKSAFSKNENELNYDNLRDWTDKSPFEYINKNVIIPEDYKIDSNTQDFSAHKLKKINDNLSSYLNNQNPNQEKKNDQENNKNIITTDKNENNSNEKDVIVNHNQNDFQENKFNKVISALMEDEEENKSEKEKEKEQTNENNNFEYNLEFDKNIKPLEFSLVKNTIGQQETIPKKNKKTKNEPVKKNIEQLKNNEKNIIENSKEEDLIENEKEEKKVSEVNKKEEKKEKGELDLTYNFDDDSFNVTQDQMDMLDSDANKIYNHYKNNIEEKNYKINHPYSYKHEAKITGEKRKQLLEPIFKKQKLILGQIIKNNISRSQNSDSISTADQKNIKNNNNNSLPKNNRYSKQNQNNYYPFFPENQNNNNYNVILSEPNVEVNLYNKKTLSSKNYSKKLNYKPYTINEYKQKYLINQPTKIYEGLGPNIGGEEWLHRKELLDRRNQYDVIIKYSDYYQCNRMMNKKKNKLKNNTDCIRSTNSSGKDSKFSTEGNRSDKNSQFKLPLIAKNKNPNIGKKSIDAINRNKKIYVSPFNPMKKYRKKELSEKEKLNRILDDSKQMEALIKYHEEHNAKVEKIKNKL